MLDGAGAAAYSVTLRQARVTIDDAARIRSLMLERRRVAVILYGKSKVLWTLLFFYGCCAQRATVGGVASVAAVQGVVKNVYEGIYYLRWLLFFCEITYRNGRYSTQNAIF